MWECKTPQNLVDLIGPKGVTMSPQNGMASPMLICGTGMTPLNMACNRRNSAIAKMFIAANAIVNLADATGSLPLHYIARCGDVNVARQLLEAGMYTQQFTNDVELKSQNACTTLRT